MTTIFGQIRTGVISANQQATLNRMRRARNNPGAPGTPRAQMFRFTRNLNAAAAAAASPSRKRTRTRSTSRSGSRSRSNVSRKKRKTSHNH